MTLVRANCGRSRSDTTVRITKYSMLLAARWRGEGGGGGKTPKRKQRNFFEG